MKSLILLLMMPFSILLLIFPGLNKIYIKPGRPNFEITAISETERLIFFGTTRGLIVQNKKTSNVGLLTQENSKLPSNRITSLISNDSGYTYIGTRDGLLIWDNFAYFVVNKENSNLPENHITSLAIDHKNTLWIGTYSRGLVKAMVDPFKFEPANLIPQGDGHIYSITFDNDGRIWVGLMNGQLFCKHHQGLEIITSQQSIDKMAPENPGTFFMNPSLTRKYLYDGDCFVSIHAESPGEHISCSYYTSKRNRLILCNQKGIYLFNCLDPSAHPVFHSNSWFLNSIYEKSNITISKQKKEKILDYLLTPDIPDALKED